MNEKALYLYFSVISIELLSTIFDDFTPEQIEMSNVVVEEK